MAGEFSVKGIDVSEWQGTIDWEKVAASGIEFAIVRVHEGWYQDIKAVTYVQGAQQHGIKIGLYQFSRADSISRATSEGKQMVEFANKYCPDMELPIFFDWELTGTNTTGAQLQDWAEAFCDTVEAGGYKAGVYYNWNLSKIAYIDSWFAEHPSYMRWFAFPDSGEPDNLDGISIWQYSWKGDIDGINADVDLNLMRYTEPEPEPEPEPDPDNPDPDNPEPDNPEPDNPEPVPEPFVRSTYGGIEYVEVRNADRDLIGIIDDAESIIWETAYYSTGRFEVYVKVTQQTIQILKVGNYVTRPDDLNIGIIESIGITWSQESGRMIAASGRFAKSLLDRRLIYKLDGNSLSPSVSTGKVESAVRKLVIENIIASDVPSRNIPFIRLGIPRNLTERIMTDSGETGSVQTSFDGLLTYTDSLLQEFHLGSYMSLDRNTKMLLYNVFKGNDRSVGNADGNTPIIFSQDFDNLMSTEYQYQSTALKTTALIGGEGEGTARFCTMIGTEASGIDRREVFVDAGSQSKKYKVQTTDAAGEPVEEEKEYTDAEYTELLMANGRQKIAPLQITETFSGEVDITHSDRVFGKDFWIGDIVTIQDTQISAYINTRILTVTEVQDKSGYTLAMSYGV